MEPRKGSKRKRSEDGAASTVARVAAATPRLTAGVAPLHLDIEGFKHGAVLSMKLHNFL